MKMFLARRTLAALVVEETKLLRPPERQCGAERGRRPIALAMKFLIPYIRLCCGAIVPSLWRAQYRTGHVQYHALDRSAGGAGAGGRSGAGGVGKPVLHLLVSALCIPSPVGLDTTRCRGSDPGVFLLFPPDGLAGERYSTCGQVSFVSVSLPETLPGQRTATRANAEARR